MDQVRVGRPNDPVSSLGKAQAKIDIVKSDAEVHFVESAELLENRFAQNHARPRYGRAILLEHRAIEVAGMPAGNVRESMAGHAPKPEHDTAVLERAIRIP